jgi:hypothetical protein
MAKASNHSCGPSGRSTSSRATVPIALEAAAATTSTSRPQAANHTRTRPIDSTYDCRSLRASSESRTVLGAAAAGVRSRGRLAAADVRLTQGLSVIRQAGMALVDRHDMRVVIVDDRAPFREAARAVLEAMVGFAVVGSAETGEEGLVLARSLRPDLVILDVNPLV